MKVCVVPPDPAWPSQFEAEAYSELKRRLAEQFPDDLEAYMDGKDAFIKEHERRALIWKQSA